MVQNTFVKPLPANMADNTMSTQENSSVEVVIPVATVLPEPVKSDQNTLWDDLTRFNRDNLVKGFVFSLILDKPRCKQRGRR